MPALDSGAQLWLAAMAITIEAVASFGEAEFNMAAHSNQEQELIWTGSASL
jgi:hypothetical protein